MVDLVGHDERKMDFVSLGSESPEYGSKVTNRTGVSQRKENLHLWDPYARTVSRSVAKFFMVFGKSGDGPNFKGPKLGRSGQYAGHPRADTRQWIAATSFCDCIAQGFGGRYPSR